MRRKKYLVLLIIVALLTSSFAFMLNIRVARSAEPVLIDYWVSPSDALRGSLYGLDGDGTYIYWLGKVNQTSFYVYKIAIENMSTVGIYHGNYNAYDWSSLCVYDDYIYVALYYNASQYPTVIAINKTTMQLVNELIIGDSNYYHPYIYKDEYASDLLWVGTCLGDYTPVIHKINITTFEEVQELIVDIPGCDDGEPYMVADENYLYCFVDCGGFFRVNKTDLSIDAFRDISLNESPIRWIYKIDNFIYLPTYGAGVDKFLIQQVNTTNRVRNFDFENGTLAPWQGQYASLDTSEYISYCHSAVLSYSGRITQTLQDPIEVSKVTSATFWAKMYGTNRNFKVFIEYTDGTNTTITYTGVSLGWNFYNITSQLESGKTIKSIAFYNLGTTGNEKLHIDDVEILGDTTYSYTTINYLYYYFTDGWAYGLFHFPDLPYFYMIDADYNSIIVLNDTSSAFQEVYSWQIPYEKRSWQYACWGCTDENNNHWLFVADSCYPAEINYADVVYKILVEPVFSVFIEPSEDQTLQRNEVLIINATAAGGTPPYTYSWYVNNQLVQTGDNASLAFSSSRLGVFEIYCNVTDSDGNYVVSDTVTIRVAEYRLIFFQTSSLLTSGSSIYGRKTIAIYNTSKLLFKYPVSKRVYKVGSRYWVFYTEYRTDSFNNYYVNLTYATSSDGVNWTRSVIDTFSIWGGYRSVRNLFDVAVVGNTLHYVIVSSESPPWNPGHPHPVMYYRMGTLNTDGSITWAAPRQYIWFNDTTPIYYYDESWNIWRSTTIDGDAYVFDPLVGPDITVDASGHVWIAATLRWLEATSIWFSTQLVYKNALTNGTWQTAERFPMIPGLLPLGDGGAGSVATPTINGETHLVYLWRTSGTALWCEIHNPNKWLSGERVDVDEYPSLSMHIASDVLFDEDNVLHVVWKATDETGTNRYLLYRYRDFSTLSSSWSDIEIIANSTILGEIADAYPVLSKDTLTDRIVCYWIANDTTLHYRIRTDNGWSDIQSLTLQEGEVFVDRASISVSPFMTTGSLSSGGLVAYVVSTEELITHKLNIASDPIENVTVRVDYANYETPAEVYVEEGPHLVSVVEDYITADTGAYSFVYWDVTSNETEETYYTASVRLGVYSDYNLTASFALGVFYRKSEVPSVEFEYLYCLPLEFYIIMLLIFFLGLYLFYKRETWKISFLLLPVIFWLIIFKPKILIEQMPIKILRMFTVPPWHLIWAIILTVIMAVLLLGKSLRAEK